MLVFSRNWVRWPTIVLIALFAASPVMADQTVHDRIQEFFRQDWLVLTTIILVTAAILALGVWEIRRSRAPTSTPKEHGRSVNIDQLRRERKRLNFHKRYTEDTHEYRYAVGWSIIELVGIAGYFLLGLLMGVMRLFKREKDEEPADNS